MSTQKNEDLNLTLVQDHRGIDERFERLLTGTCCLIGQEQLEAFELFDKAKRELIEHIRFEEEDLFPAFERVSGSPPDTGPTAVMRSEHERFRELLGRIAQRIEDGQGDAFRQEVRALLGDLKQHNLKEERVLYPEAVRLLDASLAEELARKAQARKARL